MVELSAVKHTLRHLNATVASHEDGNFTVTYGATTFLLQNSDIELYLSQKTSIKRPVPPAIFFPGFYEHAVDIQGPPASAYRLFRGEEEIALHDKSDNRSMTLAPASVVFVLAQLDSDDPNYGWRGVASPAVIRRQLLREEGNDNVADFTRLFPRVFTVRVETSLQDKWAYSLSKLKSLAEAMLFHVTYAKGTGLSLTSSWERTYHRLGLRHDSEPQCPSRTYNPELLAYYSLAFGSDSLLLAYIALYKILEYFFTSSSEKALHSGIGAKLAEPTFSHTNTKKLRELTRIIRVHDGKFDERRLLRTVLEDHLDIDEVRDWILEFDKENSAYFTTERKILSEPMKVDTSDNQLFTTIAARIYHIRNALVHHKEGEEARFIPFSGQEAILHKEIPLLLYLAECLIIRNGKDIPVSP